MQITETLSEGLKRGLRIVVPSDELDRRLSARLEEMRNTVQLKGFRRGKVPIAHLRRTFAKRVMPEVIDNLVQETTRKALDERQERPVITPKIAFAEEGAELAGVIEGKSDLDFTMEFEVMPPIEPVEFSKIELVRPTAEISDADMDEALDAIRRNQRRFEPKGDGAAAETGDRVTIDFVGRIGGEPFDGGSAEDAPLELGSGAFIPGFEEQLVGVKAGDEREVAITFPDPYGAEQLAGKDAVFSVKVKEVAHPVEAALDDTLASALGFSDLAKLKDALRTQIDRDFARASRARLKRRLLDALDGLYKFELPPSLVDAEFEGIWKSVTGDLERASKTFVDEGTTEDKARADYREIAERRIRLGLVLADVGEKNGITVSEDELNRALAERARQFAGQENQVINYYRSNPRAMAELRSPLLEEKVVDFVLELAKVSDETVTRQELFAEEDGEEHDHDHDHHDHDHHDHDHHDHDHDHHDHDHDHDHDHAHHHHDHDHGEAAADKPARKRKAKKAE